MNGLSCYPPIHALKHARPHTNSRARAQNELVYDVFYTEFSESLVPILEIYCKLKKTEILMFFKLFLYSAIDVI
jgi:hypothetical protein